jgi:uncharacterized OB-fold protein
VKFVPKDKFQSRCAAKVRRDQKGAEVAAQKINKKHKGSNAYAYQCAECGFWHVSCNCSSERFEKVNAKDRGKVRYKNRVRELDGRIGQ